MIVYCFTNHVNDKKYVGVTIHDLAYRWRGHCKQAKSGSTWRFHQAIRKHGEVAFNGEVLETCLTSEQLNEAEQRWIAQFNTYDPTFGYNMTLGGGGTVGKSHDEMTRQKMSEQAKIRFQTEHGTMAGKYHTDEAKEKNRRSQLGKKHSESTKAKMRESHTRRLPVSEETRKKLSESQRGEKHHLWGVHDERHPRFGKKHSEETKRKISETKKRRTAERRMNKQSLSSDNVSVVK